MRHFGILIVKLFSDVLLQTRTSPFLSSHLILIKETVSNNFPHAFLNNGLQIFLKLKKHFFVSKDGLSLEERKGKVDAKKENTFKYCLRS